MLAVMVDLGWPWWVTTLIAAGVVVASGAVALATRRPEARAIAAVLAVEGVAIAMIAPFVMDESTSRPAAMHAPPSAMGATSLTRAEFARRADANCTLVNDVFVAAGNPQTPAAIGRSLDRIVPAFRHGLAQQQALTPPPGERATAEHWMKAMTAFGTDFEALGRAGKAGDAARVKAASARLGADAARSARLSKQLGLKVCFS